MEAIIKFLETYSIMIEGGLALLLTVTAGWTWKYRGVLFSGLKKIADGQITRKEAHDFVDDLYNVRDGENQ